MKSIAILIFLVLTSPLHAGNVIAIDCVNPMSPDVTVTYVFDQSRNVAQIKTNRFAMADNAFYAAIVPADISDDTFVIHTQSADRTPFNDIVISRATGVGKVSTMPDVKLKCSPSLSGETFSEPILVPDSSSVISVACVGLPPRQPGPDKSPLEAFGLVVDTNSRKVLSFSGSQEPLPYGRVIDLGRDFIRFCIPANCRDVDGEQTAVLNVVNGAYALLSRNGGKLSFVSPGRAKCRAVT
jgi:hypothetical protein